MKLEFERWQKCQVELKREPNDLELLVLNGKTIDISIFDLPEDLIDWDTEEAIEEDYSFDYNHYVKKPKYLGNGK